MERLTVRVKEGNRKGECFVPGNKNAIEKIEYIRGGGRWESEEYKGKAIDKLAEYEDLEEQGKLLKLPCAVGDTVYAIEVDEENFTHFYCPRKISEYKFNLQMMGLVGMFGKCIFLTREEAEAALKGMAGS